MLKYQELQEMEKIVLQTAPFSTGLSAFSVHDRHYIYSGQVCRSAVQKNIKKKNGSSKLAEFCFDGYSIDVDL